MKISIALAYTLTCCSCLWDVVLSFSLGRPGLDLHAVPKAVTRIQSYKSNAAVAAESTTRQGSSDSVLSNQIVKSGTAVEIDFQHGLSIAPSAVVLIAAAWSCAPSLAAAAAGPVPSAFVAYAHYLSILLATALLTYERVTVSANMSVEEEKSLVIADACYGLVAVGILASGYFRVVEYGKGWEFYAHEPFFWLKASMFGVVAGLSLFPTTTFLRRGIPLFQKDDTVVIEPMSEALAARLKQVLNAEISAVLSIPLIATLMARGVWYTEDFPWPVGAGFATLALVGTSGLYLKQALGWTEPGKEETQEGEP